MATTANVLSGFGTERLVCRQLADKAAILVSSRKQPQMISSGILGYNLGLHNRQFYSQKCRGSGTATYYVRVVPVYQGALDPDGNFWAGTPTTENTTKGTTFDFQPFADHYPCTGYAVYAGTVSGTLYYQGTLSGRFNTHFVIGSTWTYSTSTSVLSPQANGVPNFVDCLEIYQMEGTVDSRCFYGGGKPYTTGYAQVKAAGAAAVLTGGTAAESAFAAWAAISDGSFRMRVGWKEAIDTIDYDFISNFDFTGIDFSGDASMSDVAATIQTAIRAAQSPSLYSGTAYESDITAWNAITDGAFDIFVNGVSVAVSSMDFSAAISNNDIAAEIEAQMQAAGGTLSAATCSWDGDTTRFKIKANIAAPVASHTLSFLVSPTAGTGTDISGLLDARETSSTAVLDRFGKGATTETVAWSTDHFVITGQNSGAQYQLSYLESVLAGAGTDISVAAYMDCLESSPMSTYINGVTAKRTVVGKGCFWGSWAIGMRFKFDSENIEYLVEDVYDEDTLLLDSDYSGIGFSYSQKYALLPYGNYAYYSAYGNPFKTDDALVLNYVTLPVSDGDTITCIKRMGRNIVYFMKNHIWLLNGANISAPIMISDFYGTPNSDCVVSYGNGLAFFTGSTFAYISGGQVTSLDPENRTEALMARLSANYEHPHGIYIQENGSDVIKWYVGLDDSFKHNAAIVYYAKDGNFALENVKDANCSAVIRSSDDKTYLFTGATYDKGHSIPAFTFLHGDDYKNDGASQTAGDTIQGLVVSAGTPTTTAGFLTCAAIGITLAGLKAVTEGYFQVTIDDNIYNVGPIDFSGAADFAACAALIQVALRLATGNTETVAYSTDHFVITSSTTTNRSNVSYLRPYIPGSSAVSISGKAYLNGEEDFATETHAVSQITLTVSDSAGGTAALNTDADKEKGCWLYVCDSDFRNGQYARISANTATTVTVTPNFVTTPAADWYWFIGGIVPSFTKWYDFGSPQHKRKLYSVNVSITPMTDTDLNYLTVHQMQDLTTTIRTSNSNAIGGAADTVQTFKIRDKESNQVGIKIMRPNSVCDLKIDDITLTQAPRV